MRIFLLQGPPGVGKTTVASALVAQHSGLIEHVQFGDYLQRQMGNAVTERSEMRRRAAELITPELTSNAVSALRDDLAAIDGKDVHVLLESRDVALRDHGIKASSISLKLVQGLDCQGIFLLTTTSAVVASRVASREGHDMLSTSQLEHYYTCQIGFAAATAVAIGCGLHLVDAEGEPEDVATTIHALMMT